MPAAVRDKPRRGRRPVRAALARQQLPRAGRVESVEAYGRQAIVRMTGDTLFLPLFPAGRRVVAAGRTPPPDRPYDCAVTGA
ncbi:hypothetical protein [Streptomyces sp. NPDC096033]|uniref:hypothetical protein n=1 Tax=Streptomyces sp. NPDC096033 TaxID=3366071 RepID=UPI003819E42D